MDVHGVMLMLALCTGLVHSPPSVPITLALTQLQPDTTKAKGLDRWPNAQDIAKLQSAEGKPRWMVLLILGHPSMIEKRPNGEEVWDYPWVACCRVGFKNGICTGTFYTAGF